MAESDSTTTQGDTGALPTIDSTVDAMVAVVTMALPGSRCDKADHVDGGPCGEPAVVAISLDVWSAPLIRCRECWPSLDEVLQIRSGPTTLSNY